MVTMSLNSRYETMKGTIFAMLKICQIEKSNFTICRAFRTSFHEKIDHDTSHCLNCESQIFIICVYNRKVARISVKSLRSENFLNDAF